MKILLVKLSSLGDVVHTLPVVQDIRQALPDAQIDWVVEQGFAPLLAHAAGLRRVIPCDMRRWRKSFWTAVTRREWQAFKARLRDEAYDAVIDLQGLTKSAVIARLARLADGGRRYALANQTDGSGYEAPTRWVADTAIPIEPHTHAVQRGRLLCAAALGYTVQGAPDFGLRVDGAAAGRDGRPVVAFVHGTSRVDKTWPVDHWVALGRRLIAAGFDIGLPHGNDAELLTSQTLADALNHDRLDTLNAVVWPRLSLDAMTEALVRCAGVIGVDSGLSHIAVALDLPHVQLYNFDTAWRTGPLDARRQRSVYAQPAPSVDAVWLAWQACSAQALTAAA